MYRTKFTSADYTLVLSWNADHNESLNTSISTDLNSNLIARVNGLYDNVQNLCSEFVECLKQVKNGNTSSSRDNHLNLSFIVDDLTLGTLYKEEENQLVKDVGRLQELNERLESELKSKAVSDGKEISELKYQHELNIQDLKNKHENEMSELRIYFEKIYSENLKQLTVDQHYENKSKSHSTSDNKSMGGNRRLYHAEFNRLESETVSELNTKIDDQETVNKGLKNCIIKVIDIEMDKFKNMARTKVEEIQKLKKDNGRCLEMIESLQAEVKRLMYNEELGDKVKEICSELRKDYETYIRHSQETSDMSSLMVLKKENYQDQDKLKQIFENTLNELDSISELEITNICDLLVKFVIKSVFFEEHVKQLSDEKEVLVNQVEDYRVENDLRNREIENLKKNLGRELKFLNNCDKEMYTDNISALVTKLKKNYDDEVYKLSTENSTLKHEIRNLANEIHSCRHQKVLKTSADETQVCTTRETNPSDVISNTIELHQVLEGRNDLKSINVALRWVIQMFTNYLTTCETELSDTFIGALKAWKLNKRLNYPTGVTLSDLDGTLSEQNDKSVNESFNHLRTINVLQESEYMESPAERNHSVNEADLECWLAILQSEASSLCNLISAQKSDGNDAKPNRDEYVQTDLKSCDIDFMDKCIKKSENEMGELLRDVESLQKHIYASDSIEGYGEASNSLTQNDKAFNNVGNYGSCSEEVLENEIEELSERENCENCERIVENTKKVIEDLQTQLTAMKKKCESDEQFLERQTAERESEREESDVQIKLLTEQLKEKERDLNRRNKFESEMQNLEQQVKELTDDLENCKASKESLESRLKSAESKIWQLRERNQELEMKLAHTSEHADQVEMKFKAKDEKLKELQVAYQSLLQQLDSWSDGNVNQLEEFSEQHATSSAVIEQMKTELTEIEKLVVTRIRDLESGYLIVPSVSVISSPSEDISVTERIRLLSPAESDTLSSPSRETVSINLLSCLNDKLKILFSAEDATFKKIRDQDMELGKQNDLLATLHLERNMLAESLRTSTDKVAQMKIQLDDWDYRSQTCQSDIQLKLTDKIRSLESQIEHYKKFLSQKDYTESELTKIIKDLKDYISNSECEFSEKCEKTEQIVVKLQQELNGLRQEKRALRTILGGHDETDRSEEPRTTSSILMSSNSMHSDTDIIINSKKQRVSFAENLESCIDSDVSRRAVTVEISSLPMISPFASPGKSLLLSSRQCGNISTHSLKSIEKTKLDLNSVLPMKIKVPNSDSMNINSDAFTSTKNHTDEGASYAVFDGSSRESQIFELQEKVDTMTSLYENERRNCSKLKNLNNATKYENRCLKESENILQKKKTALEDELQSVLKPLNIYKHQCQDYEEQILSLTDKLKSSNKIIDDLKNSLSAIHKEREDEQSQKYFNDILKQKIEIEKKCSEYSKQVEKLQESLKSEKNRVANLCKVVQTPEEESAALQDILRKMEHWLEKANDDKNVNNEPVTALMQPTGSLRDLTEKVQKEVEIASELDENMLKRLESTSSNSSALNELLRVSPNLNEDVKKTLLKILTEGCETITSNENRILVDSLNLHNPGTFRYLEEKENIIRSLQNEVDSQKKSVLRLRAEINHLEQVHAYNDERLSRYVMKVDDYRQKNNKLEIELTSERCKFTQQENQHRREVVDLKEECKKQREEYIAQNTALVDENLSLKKEIERLISQLEALSAEHCSRRTHIDSKSSAESELNKFLHPLKVKLSQEHDKYSLLKTDYEKLKNELTRLKSILKLEQNSRRKLDTMYKDSLNEKAGLQKRLSEMKLELDTLTWQNQRVEDKLKAAEVSDMKMRKLLSFEVASNRAKCELPTESQKLLEKDCAELKMKMSKIQEQYDILYYSWKKVGMELQEVFNRCLHAESRRRCLVFQKNFFVNECFNLLNGKNILNVYSTKFLEDTGNARWIPKLTPRLKFKSVAVCIQAIRRVKRLLVRRQEEYSNLMIQHMSQKLPNVRIYPHYDFTTAEKNIIKDSACPRNLPDLFIDKTEKTFMFVDDSIRETYFEFLNLKKTYIK